MQMGQGIQGQQTAATNTLATLLALFYNNPTAFFGVMVSGITGRIVSSGGVIPDAYELLHYFLLFLFAVASVSFLLWALPKSIHVFVNALVCAIFSLLMMSWCMNSEEKCKTYFVVTSEKINHIYMAAAEFVFKLIP